jgi:hypothetical protein
MKCYVFDLDGTLADPTHRLWYVLKPDKDWSGFFAACGEDAVIEPVAELYNTLRCSTFRSYTGCKMVIMSGRSDECREQTEAWLERAGLMYDALYMRKAGDHRPDYKCKKDLLAAMLKDGYEPILFVDDRQQVVDMWRELGYTCLQCAPGGF